MLLATCQTGVSSSTMLRERYRQALKVVRVLPENVVELMDAEWEAE